MATETEQERRLHRMMENELEQSLVRQEQQLQPGTSVPIVEQADGQGRSAYERLDGSDVITAGGSGTSGNAGAGGETIGDPGRGTDESALPMQDNRRTPDVHLADDNERSWAVEEDLNDQPDFAEDAITRDL